jgi:DNA-binding LytR/AlgR family response regulator
LRPSAPPFVTAYDECAVRAFEAHAVDYIHHVRELTPWFSGAWRVKLSTGAELDVSRARFRHLKRELQL